MCTLHTSLLVLLYTGELEDRLDEGLRCIRLPWLLVLVCDTLLQEFDHYLLPADLDIAAPLSVHKIVSHVVLSDEMNFLFWGGKLTAHHAIPYQMLSCSH